MLLISGVESLCLGGTFSPYSWLCHFHLKISVILCSYSFSNMEFLCIKNPEFNDYMLYDFLFQFMFMVFTSVVRCMIFRHATYYIFMFSIFGITYMFLQWCA